MATTEQNVQAERLEALLGRVVVDCGATVNAALVLIGDELGLYRALARRGPAAPDQIATDTNTTERYVREWLNAQAASGYVEYDPETGRYAMTPEQALAFAEPSSPVFLPGAFQTAVGALAARALHSYCQSNGSPVHTPSEGNRDRPGPARLGGA